MNESIIKRIFKVEKFFSLKKPKEMNYIQWGEKLFELQQEWEEENHEEFPF